MLIDRSHDILDRYPLEIYYSALLLLPKQVCSPLSREREKHLLPVIANGVPDTWLPPPDGCFDPFANVLSFVTVGPFTKPDKEARSWSICLDEDGMRSRHGLGFTEIALSDAGE